MISTELSKNLEKLPPFIFTKKHKHPNLNSQKLQPNERQDISAANTMRRTKSFS